MSLCIMSEKRTRKVAALKSRKMKLDFRGYLKQVDLHWKQVEKLSHVLRK